MLRRFRHSFLVALVALTTATVTGCFGRFRVTNAVYDFNKTINHKVARTLVMWAMVIIPVYEVAAVADIFIFNVIEFWGGSSGLSDQTLPDGRRVEFARLSPDVLRVRVIDPHGRVEDLEVVKVGARAGYLRRPGGAILAEVEQTNDGQIISRAMTGP